MRLANSKELTEAQKTGMNLCTATRTYADALGDFSKTQCKLYEGHIGDHIFESSDIPDVEMTSDSDGLKLTFRIPLN
jgi:hypothetical protein